MSPSSTKSSVPLHDALPILFQLAAVKVRLAGETVPSAVLLEERPIVTLAVGCELRTTVNVAVRSEERGVGKVGGETVMPAVSLSELVAETSAAFRPL